MRPDPFPPGPDGDEPDSEAGRQVHRLPAGLPVTRTVTTSPTERPGDM